MAAKRFKVSMVILDTSDVPFDVSLLRTEITNSMLAWADTQVESIDVVEVTDGEPNQAQ